MKPRTCRHGALCNKLDSCNRFIFQKLLVKRIYFCTEKEIFCIAETELFKSYPKTTQSFQSLTKLLNQIFITIIHAASPVQLIFSI